MMGWQIENLVKPLELAPMVYPWWSDIFEIHCSVSRDTPGAENRQQIRYGIVIWGHHWSVGHLLTSWRLQNEFQNAPRDHVSTQTIHNRRWECDLRVRWPTVGPVLTTTWWILLLTFAPDHHGWTSTNGPLYCHNNGIPYKTHQGPP